MTRYIYPFAIVVLLASPRVYGDDWTGSSASPRGSEPVTFSLNGEELAESEALSATQAALLPISAALAGPSVAQPLQDTKDCGCYVTEPCGCNPCGDPEARCYVGEKDACWMCDSVYCDVDGCAGPRNTTAVRLGWWFSELDGNPVKVGEYQDLSSSPFYEVDGLLSDGTRSIDFYANGLDNEANQVGVDYYGPAVKVDFYFQRFIRRLDHDPLSNYNIDMGYGPGVYEQAPRYNPFGYVPGNEQYQGVLTTPGSTTSRGFNSQDMNVGEDYAIRVEQLEGEISGHLTEHLKYRVKAWGMRKFGERQASAQVHCFSGDLAAPGVPADHPFTSSGNLDGGRSCHLLSGRQQIDWLTQEVTPSIEGRWGALTVEYSHTMRAFYQDDQPLTRYFTSSTEDRALGYDAVNKIGTVGDYAFVPENFTHYGQVKIGYQFSECRNLYAVGLFGNTHNKYRLTDRKIFGADVRYMDRSVPGFQTTLYAKMHGQENEFPGFYRYDDLGPPPSTNPNTVNPGDIVDSPSDVPLHWRNTDPNGFGFLLNPWDYTRTSVGIKTRWRPESYRRLSVVAGYDYTNWDRTYSGFEAVVPLDPTASDPDETTHEDFVVGTTVYHTLKLRPQFRWTRYLNSYVDYKHRWIDDPMFAVHEPNGVTNSSRPTSEDLIRIGGSWSPSDQLMLDAWFGIENRAHRSEYANFDEDDYPIVATMWYAPTCNWSLTLGYAYLNNWIDQDITVGDQIGGFRGDQTDPNAIGRVYLNPVTEQYSYGGRSHVVTLGGTYVVNCDLTLVGGVEYVDGVNTFASPELMPDLPSFSRVDVDTWRLNAGADFRIAGWLPSYVRYNLFDYGDNVDAYNSGTIHYLLAGMTWVH